jgi:hypothetical protein
VRDLATTRSRWVADLQKAVLSSALRSDGAICKRCAQLFIAEALSARTSSQVTARAEDNATTLVNAAK